MGTDAKPGDPADKPLDAKADGAFGGVTSHRAGYGDRLARVEEWLRKHPSATLASGEGAVLLAEIDQLRRQIEIFVDMAATWVKVGHENERLQDAIDRVREELEREQMRLAACGVVAMANTPDTAAKARDILPEYRSASCDDVARVVDENMKLRAAIKRVRALHKANDYCCGKWGCPTLRALDGEDA